MISMKLEELSDRLEEAMASVRDGTDVLLVDGGTVVAVLLDPAKVAVDGVHVHDAGAASRQQERVESRPRAPASQRHGNRSEDRELEQLRDDFESRH